MGIKNVDEDVGSGNLVLLWQVIEDFFDVVSCLLTVYFICVNSCCVSNQLVSLVILSVMISGCVSLSSGVSFLIGDAQGILYHVCRSGGI